MKRIGLSVICFFWSLQVQADCLIAVSGVNFGAYNALSFVHEDSSGSINVTCAQATPYNLTISPGNGTAGDRFMISGSNLLYYNLYIDAGRSLVWGDGSNGTHIRRGSGSTNELHTIYGRIPAAQRANIGVYSDTIVVTLVY